MLGCVWIKNQIDPLMNYSLCLIIQVVVELFLKINVKTKIRKHPYKAITAPDCDVCRWSSGAALRPGNNFYSTLHTSSGHHR
jgi:hypothetical protein